LYKSEAVGECFVILNDLEKAREILLTTDEYIEGFSQFDFHSKMQTTKNVTAEEFKAFQASCVLPWTEEDIKNWKMIIPMIRENFQVFSRLPLPNVIYLNLTSGKEEADAAYTRGRHGIFLPRNMVNWFGDVVGLLLHETWHIISRNLRYNNPQLRHDIYACIGFKPMGHLLEFPSELPKISNPDAPLLEHYITVTLSDNSVINVLPIIFSKIQQYDPNVHRSFFSLMVIKLLVVKQNSDGQWVIDRINQPHLRDISGMPKDFWDQIGQNTSYLIHPEETIADNFKYIFSPPDNFPNPEIPEKISSFFL